VPKLERVKLADIITESVIGDLRLALEHNFCVALIGTDL